MKDPVFTMVCNAFSHDLILLIGIHMDAAILLLMDFGTILNIFWGEFQQDVNWVSENPGHTPITCQ